MERATPVDEPALRERPRSVSVIGWTFLVLSLFRLLVDSWGAIVWKFGDVESLLSLIPRSVGMSQRLTDSVFRNFVAILAVQSVVAASVAWVSYSLLRLRPWSRRSMEVVCWLCLVLVPCLDLILLTDSPSLAGTRSLRILVAAGGSAVAAGLIGWAIWCLRRPLVRRAFQTADS